MLSDLIRRFISPAKAAEILAAGCPSPIRDRELMTQLHDAGVWTVKVPFCQAWEAAAVAQRAEAIHAAHGSLDKASKRSNFPASV
jgi:hypothetical protein